MTRLNIDDQGNLYSAALRPTSFFYPSEPIGNNSPSNTPLDTHRRSGDKPGLDVRGNTQNTCGNCRHLAGYLFVPTQGACQIRPDSKLKTAPACIFFEPVGGGL
jgi:hypothetical protein